MTESIWTGVTRVISNLRLIDGLVGQKTTTMAWSGRLVKSVTIL